MNNPDEIDQLRALLEAKDAYWKNVCAKLMMEVKKSKNEVDRLKTRLAVEQDRSKVRGDSLPSATARINELEARIKDLEAVVGVARHYAAYGARDSDSLREYGLRKELKKALAALDEKKKP